MKLQKLDEFYIHHLDTGDILLCDHKNNYSSFYNCVLSIFDDCIKFLTSSKYTHCGIIIRDPSKIFKDNNLSNGLYILESTYEGTPDQENSRIKLGVQLTSLIDFIGRSHSDIYWRQLVCERTPEFYEKLMQAHSDVHNLPYDTNPIDWLKATF